MSSTTLTPTADAYTRDGSYDATNYGSASDLQVKYSSTGGEGYNRNTYLTFNLSSVSTIGEATLRLFGSVNNDTETLIIGAYGESTTSWGQNSIDWNNQPSAGTLQTITSVSGETAQWYSWDLTGYLQAQKAAGHSTVSIELAGTTSTDGYGDFNPTNAGSDQPQLVVASADASLTPTNDSYVQDSTDDATNFGTSTSLLSKVTGGVDNRNTFITYNTSGTTGNVTGAYLEFTGGVESGGSNTDIPVNVYAVSSTGWSQSTITWNNQPTAGTTIQATTTVIDTTTREYTFDVSSYVEAQRAAGDDTVSFMVQSGAITTSSIIDFNSSRASSGTPALVLSETATGPSVATPAAASPSTVTGTTTSLSVLGSDPAGESSLTYTWAATSVPSGASSPTFSTNGTNAAKSDTATFSAAGAYTFQATITDAGGLYTTSSVNVTVDQTLNSISLTPTSAALNENGTQVFTPSAKDQFGIALATQPTFTWSKTGVGALNTSGLYTAPGATGTATVTATSASISGNASVTVTNAAPTVATPAAASPSTVTGTTTALTVLGADDGGESFLTYTWAATSIPSGASAPTYSANGTNASKSTTATFSEAGAYTFQVTITDLGGLTATSSVSVTVSQTATGISVTPGTPTLGSAGTQQFSASELDQFGNAMATQPTFTWTNSGAGSVNSTGLYTAPAASGSDTVTATSGSLSGNASVMIAAPGVDTAVAVEFDPTSGVGLLGVVGSDPNGESTLTYTWAATSSPSGSTVTFGDTADNTAKDCGVATQ